jgi:hypothetical protein
VKTKSDIRILADAIGVDIRTIHNWRKRADYPKNASAEDVRKWAEGLGLGRGSKHASYAELREQKLKEEIALLRLKKRKEEGKAIASEDVFAYLGRLAAKWDQLLTQKLDVEIPVRLQGKDIVAARAEAQLVHDEIRAICNAGITSAGKDLVA